MLALSAPELDVRAVTTVGGNAGLGNTTANALRLLHLLGRDDIPVGAGADVPLCGGTRGRPRASTAPTASVGSASTPRPRRGRPAAAVAAHLDVVDASAEPVTLIALGPLTNVAALLASSPGRPPGLAGSCMMGGGARVLGNMTPPRSSTSGSTRRPAARVFQRGARDDGRPGRDRPGSDGARRLGGAARRRSGRAGGARDGRLLHRLLPRDVGTDASRSTTPSPSRR